MQPPRVREPPPEALHQASGLAREGGEREREKRIHSPFALHAPIQWAIQGDVTAEEGVIECPPLFSSAESYLRACKVEDYGEWRVTLGATVILGDTRCPPRRRWAWQGRVSGPRRKLLRARCPPRVREPPSDSEALHYRGTSLIRNSPPS